MSRNILAILLIGLNLLAIGAATLVPLAMGIKAGHPALHWVCGIGTIFIFGLLTNIGQLLFVLKVKTDDPISELIMPWSLANLWDDPEKYFEPGVDKAYRAYRVFINIAMPVLLIGAIVYIVVS